MFALLLFAAPGVTASGIGDRFFLRRRRMLVCITLFNEFTR